VVIISNDGFINTGMGAEHALTVDNMRDPYSIKMGGTRGNQKAVFTSQFWLNPPWGRPRAIDYTLLEEYENNEWIRMVITHIIDSIVQTDFNIVATDENKIIQSHIDEVTEFFKAKNWQESWQETLRRMLPDLLLYDAGVLIKVFPKNAYDQDMQLKGDAKPVELVCRDGRSFLKNTDLYGYIDKYHQYSWISPRSKPITFQPNEIIYMMMRPQSRSPYGVASLETIMSIVDYLTASINANRKYWENGMFIGGQIDHPDINDIDEMQSRAEMYQQELKGEQNYNKWLLTFGGTKVTPLAFTNQQMQWLQTAEFFGRIVFAIFKVTPSELGFTDGLNHATADIQSKVYKSKGVQNILDLLEEYINREIIWKHFHEDIEFKFNRGLDLDDETKQTNIDHTMLTDGTITINQIRNRNGDDIYEDDIYNFPFAEMNAQDALMSSGEEEGKGEESEEYDEEDSEMSYKSAIKPEDLEGEE
jgi:hypothetical protein